MKKADRIEFFKRLKSVTPEPKTELNYESPFELLVAVILSAQATDVSVNKATRSLFATAPTAEAMLALGDLAEEFERHIRVIARFVEVTEDHIPYLLRKAEIIEQVNRNMERLARRVPDKRIQVYNP